MTPRSEVARGVRFDLGIIRGVVDEDIHAAEFCYDHISRTLNRGFAGNVSCETQAFGAVRELELVGAQSRTSRGKIQHDNVCSGGCEDRPMMIPKQAGPACHDSNATRQVEQVANTIIFGDHTQTSLQGTAWRSR